MTMCSQARDAVLASIKSAIVLSVSRLLLTLGPAGYDTYYNMQVAGALPEVIFAVLLAGGLGSVWLQILHRRAGG
jgi:hypothetical protein